MGGKRYSTEEKIRILGQADRGESIEEVCRQNHVSEQTYPPLETGVRDTSPHTHRGNGFAKTLTSKVK